MKEEKDYSDVNIKFDIKKEKSWTPIPNKLLNNIKLSVGARLLGSLYCSNKKGWKSNAEDYAKKMGINIKTIYKYNLELQENGYLKIGEIPANKSGIGKIVHVYTIDRKGELGKQTRVKKPQKKPKSDCTKILPSDCINLPDSDRTIIPNSDCTKVPTNNTNINKINSNNDELLKQPQIINKNCSCSVDNSSSKNISSSVGCSSSSSSSSSIEEDFSIDTISYTQKEIEYIEARQAVHQEVKECIYQSYLFENNIQHNSLNEEIRE